MTLLNILLKKLLMNSRGLIVKAKPRNPSSKNIQNNNNSVCDGHFFVKTPPIKNYGLHSSPLYVLIQYAFFAREKNKLKKTTSYRTSSAFFRASEQCHVNSG